MIPFVPTEGWASPCHDDPIGTFMFLRNEHDPRGAHDEIWLVVPSHRPDRQTPGELIILPVHTGEPLPGIASWHWDGSRERPTLAPSIFVDMRNTPPGWHGFARAGVLETC